MRQSIQQFTQRFAHLRHHKSLTRFGAWRDDQNLWHINRNSVARAVSVGLFVAFLPIPMQMVVAAFIAIFSRANLIISVVLVWITNPLTMPAIFYSAYKLGQWVLRYPVAYQLTERNWLAYAGHFWPPLILGSLMLSVFFAASGQIVVRLLWRMHIICKRSRARDFT